MILLCRTFLSIKQCLLMFPMSSSYKILLISNPTKLISSPSVVGTWGQGSVITARFGKNKCLLFKHNGNRQGQHHMVDWAGHVHFPQVGIYS